MNLTKIRRLLAQNKLEDAIQNLVSLLEDSKQLADFYFDMIHFSARYYELIEKFDRHSEIFSVKYNKILLGINELIRDLENSIIKEDQENYLFNFIPNVNPLFSGRISQLKLLENALDKYKMVSIEGIGGIGKTQLAAKFIQPLGDQKEVIWINAQSDFTFDNLIHLTGFYGILVSKEYSYNEKRNRLLRALEKSSKVIFIDNFQEIEDQFVIKFLKWCISRLHNVQFVLLTRSAVQIKSCFPILVDGLEDDGLGYAKDLIREFDLGENLSGEKLVNVCKRLNGHPLAIELFVEILRVEENTDKIFNLIFEESPYNTEMVERLLGYFFEHDKVDSNRVKFLERMSIFRGDVDVFAIENILDDFYEPEYLHVLVRHFMVSLRNGLFGTHSLVKEFCYKRLAEKEQKKLHLRAAEYFIVSRDPLKLEVERELEITHHYRTIGQKTYLKDLIKDQSEKYLMFGYASALEELMEEADFEKTSPHFYHLNQARIAKRKYEYKKALKHFDLAIKGNDEDFASMIDALNESSIHYFQTRNTAESLERVYEAYLLSKDLYYVKGLANALNIAAILFKHINIKRVNSIYDEKIAFGAIKLALEIAVILDSPFLDAELNNTYGRMYQNQKDYNSAIEQFKRANKNAVKANNIIFEASSLTNIGTCIFDNARIKGGHHKKTYSQVLKDTLFYHVKAFSVHERSGTESVEVLQLIISNLAITYSEVPDKLQAIKYLKEGFRLCRRSKMHYPGSTILVLLLVSLRVFHVPSILNSIYQGMVALKDIGFSVLKGIFVNRKGVKLEPLLLEVKGDVEDKKFASQFIRISQRLSQ